MQLAAGRNIEAINQSILREKPGRIGTGGDWDFHLVEFTVILYRFGDQPEVLYPETRRYIVDVLMTEKRGEFSQWVPDPIRPAPAGLGKPYPQLRKFPVSTNQWIAQHGNPDPRYDNVKNGLEAHLLGYLREKDTCRFLRIQFHALSAVHLARPAEP